MRITVELNENGSLRSVTVYSGSFQGLIEWHYENGNVGWSIIPKE